jgi:hypothetical protein
VAEEFFGERKVEKGLQAYLHYEVSWLQILVRKSNTFVAYAIRCLIRKVKIEDRFSTMTEHEQEIIIQKKIAKASLQYLEEKYGKEREQNKHLDNLLARLQLDVNFFQQDVEDLNKSNENVLSKYQRIYLELLEQQRKLLHAMNQRTEFDEELIRKYLALTDLEEFKLREKLFDEIRLS